MKVKDIMNERPCCCTPDSTLREAAQLMNKTETKEIPVIDSLIHRHPLGIITADDIACRIAAEGFNPQELTVGEFMTVPCATVTPEMSVEECEKVLEENHLHRVPVINFDGECCGIVEEADLSASLKEKKNEALKTPEQYDLKIFK